MYFTLMVILGVVLIAALVTYFISKRRAATTESRADKEDYEAIRAISMGVGLTAFILAGLLTVLMAFTVVSARSVTIVTTFGADPNVLQPGMRWTQPWSDKVSYSTLNQPIDLNDYDDSKGNSVYVTFSSPTDPSTPDALKQAGGGNGNISAVPTWHVDQTGQGATQLWLKYTTQEEASERLVKPAAQEAISSVANNYTAGIATVNQDKIGREAAVVLQERLKRYGIIIDGISIKKIDLDERTKASLQKIVDAANTQRQYEQDKINSAIQNEILAAREKAGALSREANERYCLDLVRSWDVKEQGPMPATFGCFGGSNASVLVQTPAK